MFPATQREKDAARRAGIVFPDDISGRELRQRLALWRKQLPGERWGRLLRMCQELGADLTGVPTNSRDALRRTHHARLREVMRELGFVDGARISVPHGVFDGYNGPATVGRLYVNQQDLLVTLRFDSKTRATGHKAHIVAIHAVLLDES